MNQILMIEKKKKQTKQKSSGSGGAIETKSIVRFFAIVIIVFGIILGLLTGIFRIFGANAEGVSYAIIFSNLLVPLIERYTVPTAFGKGGKQA